MQFLNTHAFKFILCFLLQVVKCDKTTVVPPDDTSKTPVGLLIVPGAGLSADQYLPLGKQIQKVSNYSVYLATVGGFIVDTPNPLQLPGAIKDAVSKLHQAGLNKASPIFIGAHSLGGVFLDMFVRGKDNIASGIILYGSYISHSVKLADYPVPVLTIAGDQDGLCRMTRIAKDFGQLTSFNYKTPVVIVPGANHSQIASGKMPLNVELNDLIADNTEEETHEALATATNAFMVVNGPQLVKIAREQAAAVLGKQYVNTKSIVTPYLEAVQMDTSPFPTWASFAAILLGGVSDTSYNINVRSSITPPGDFKTVTPKSVKPDSKTINLTVPIHNDMPFNPLDISLTQQSPEQQWVKTLSQQAFEKVFPNSTFYKPPKGVKDINQATSNTAILGLPAEYYMRYMSRGRRLEFLPDMVCTTLSEWTSASITWKLTTAGAAYVRSPIYQNDEFAFAKFLTLSKVYEWILIDSFKK